MRTLLAIDPGKHTGFALFYEGELVRCGVVTPYQDMGAGCLGPDQVVIEFPRIYPQGHPRPNDLLELAAVAGRYEERFRDSRIELIYPREWKGTISGDIMCRRIETSLTPIQADVLAAYKGGHRHNAIDAIGLGLWSLKQPFYTRTG